MSEYIRHFIGVPLFLNMNIFVVNYSNIRMYSNMRYALHATHLCFKINLPYTLFCVVYSKAARLILIPDESLNICKHPLGSFFILMDSLLIFLIILFGGLISYLPCLLLLSIFPQSKLVAFFP